MAKNVRTLSDISQNKFGTIEFVLDKEDIKYQKLIDVFIETSVKRKSALSIHFVEEFYIVKLSYIK